MNTSPMNSSKSDIGLIGLAVMGQNLALNIADHGFPVSVYNRTYSKTENFLKENTHLGDKLKGFAEIEGFISSLENTTSLFGLYTYSSCVLLCFIHDAYMFVKDI